MGGEGGLRGLKERLAEGGEAARDGNAVGEEDVGQRGEGDAEMRAGHLHDGEGERVPLGGVGDEVAEGLRQVDCCGVLLREGGAGQQGFSAAPTAAGAGGAVGEDDDVAGVAESAEGRAQDGAVDDHADTEASSTGGAEEAVAAPARAEEPLAGTGGVGIAFEV